MFYKSSPVIAAAVALLAFTLPASAVGSGAATVTIKSSQNPSQFGKTVTLTASVSPSDATGTVTFFDGTSFLGIAPLTGSQATLAKLLLPCCTNSIRGLYSGDVNYAVQSSAPLTQMVSALPQNGFKLGAPYAQAGSVAMASGDFNGDGVPDFVTVERYQSQITVFLGNPNGTLQTGVMYSTDQQPDSVAVADFNGDGKLDLVTTNAIGGVGEGSYSILLGDGAGNFAPAVNTETRGQNPLNVLVADFNGDGIADLAWINGISNSISVVLGKGNGKFGAEKFPANPGGSEFQAGDSPVAMAVGDFNHDGRVDLAVAIQGLSGSLEAGELYPVGNLYEMLGNGDGTFQPGTPIIENVQPNYILTGDLTGNGGTDLVIVTVGNGPCGTPVITEAVDDCVGVMLGNPDGSFQPIAYFGLTANPSVLALGDFNGDGKPDIFTVNSSFGAAPGNLGFVLLGNGDGSFQTPVSYDVGSEPYQVFVADVNGDGITDVVVGNFAGLDVLLGVAPAPASGVSVAPGGVLNAASFAKDSNGHGTAVAPGSLVSIYGVYPGATTASAATPLLPDSLGVVSVTFNGVPAPLLNVVPSGPDINAQVPFEALAAGQTSANVNIVVTVNKVASVPQSTPVAAAAPGIFTIPPNGLGNAVLVFVDPADNIVKIAAPAGSSAAIGYPTAPIPRGSSGYFYATGLGGMTPPVADGDTGGDVTHYANSLPLVTVGAISAPVIFAGQAPGFAAVNQINVTIPENAPTGNAVTLLVKSSDGSVISNAATIAVR